MVHESQVPRSCDRCHSLKERCRRTSKAPRCDRCTRTGRVCETQRPTRRPGRPPARLKTRTERKSHSSDTTISTTSECSVTLAGCTLPWETLSSSFGNITQQEMALLDKQVLHDDSIQLFVVGPSFCESHRERLVFHLLSSRHPVLDGCLALALCTGDKLQIHDSYKHAASALFTLRSLSVVDEGDSASCLTLGWLVLQFALRVGGEEVFDICNQTLGLIKPYFDYERAFNSACSGFLTSLVLSEMAESLFKARVPTMRLDHPKAFTHVDSYVGLSTSLLPHLYDLAMINAAMHSNRFSTEHKDEDSEETARQQEYLAMSLNVLECEVRSWKPNVPTDICDKYTAAEVAHMICQAQVMQTAILLIIHRLKYPFGTEDSVARTLASNIINYATLARQITGKLPVCIDLPLNVAILELGDDSEPAAVLSRIALEDFHLGEFYKRFRIMIALVWRSRLLHHNVYWYNIGDIILSAS
ncbi:hypothetical protein QQS21_006194 [Conoideocrella luteorostrata]|uniref:Zn(2)-C6 fungal-type domain-containing protein n=1 Tax=Conoideocrella luteorostrata TaxID=1105319 RepID=A0AAJ0CN23_9HYPO|nr:hypothetical protein QQS21_006194 [Conoideocrella luteorostrata]